MAEAATKDRDLNVPTVERTSASGPSLPNSAKVRNKLLDLQLKPVNGPKKQPKKVITADKILVLWWWAAFCLFGLLHHFIFFICRQ